MVLRTIRAGDRLDPRRREFLLEILSSGRGQNNSATRSLAISIAASPAATKCDHAHRPQHHPEFLARLRPSPASRPRKRPDRAIDRRRFDQNQPHIFPHIAARDCLHDPARMKGRPRARIPNRRDRTRASTDRRPSRAAGAPASHVHRRDPTQQQVQERPVPRQPAQTRHPAC